MSGTRHPVPTGSSEGLAWRVARALGGSLVRVTRAVGDYAAPGGSSGRRRPRTSGDHPSVDEDTGEWPAPGADPGS